MQARKTPSSNSTYRLAGGTEDNDLPTRVGVVGDEHVEVPLNDPGLGMPYVASVWEPDQDERAALATGLANIELVILGEQPPVIVRTTREQPTGSPLRIDTSPRVWTELPLALAVDVAEALRTARNEDVRMMADVEAVDRLIVDLDGYASRHLDELKAQAEEDVERERWVLDLTELDDGVTTSIIGASLAAYRARHAREPDAVRVTDAGGQAIDRDVYTGGSSTRTPRVERVAGVLLLRGDEQIPEPDPAPDEQEPRDE